MITKELIQNRMLELQQQAETLKANLNAISGAIQDCEFWITELEKEVSNEN